MKPAQCSTTEPIRQALGQAQRKETAQRREAEVAAPAGKYPPEGGSQ